jgi:hypothetical protein
MEDKMERSMPRMPKLLRLAAPLTLVGLAFGGLVGCGSYDNEDVFIERVAKESCDLNRKCYYAFYLDEFSDHNDCVDDTIDDYEDLSDFFDDIDCDYDPDAAADCVDAVRKASKTCEENDLEDVDDACEDVYDC